MRMGRFCKADVVGVGRGTGNTLVLARQSRGGRGSSVDTGGAGLLLAREGVGVVEHGWSGGCEAETGGR